MICRQGDGDESNVQRTFSLYHIAANNYGFAISFHNNI